MPPEGVAIVGDNAQGKSNLLEAIYYLETFRSFRGARDDRLIAFGQDVFWISATLCASGQEEDAVESAVSAAFQRPGGRKKVTVDGAEAERVGDALGHLAAVIFSPADIQFISGAPAERRRFLNVVLSLNEPGYLGALQHFRHVLAQRNAALKDGQDAPAVHAWDGPLLGHAAVVMDARQRWISEWNTAFADFCEVVSGGQRGRMVYEPNVPRVGTQAAGPGMSVADEVKRDSPRGVSGWEDAYGEALARTRERERRQGVTVVGPQRAIPPP